MKKLLTFLFFSCCGFVALANHITGGEIIYTFQGMSGSDYKYHITLKLYRDYYAPPGSAQLDPQAAIAIFNNANNQLVLSKDVDSSKVVDLQLTHPNPCINNPPPVRYQVGYYEFDVTLPATPQGYTIAYQRCCRIAGINNLINSSTVGATYTAQIPGTSQLADAPANNSAYFNGSDSVALCAHNPFTYDFGAKDPDKDSLYYYFCNAYVGGTTNQPAPNPPFNPPYSSVPYTGVYDADSPLGSGVKLNSKTGMISGLAPDLGIYVVTVCVDEYRNGIKIATHRKDLQIKVADCSLTTPMLEPLYINCDGNSLSFANQNMNPLIDTYNWSFGDGHTSTDPTPTNVYTNPGTYQVKLVVNPGEPCSDSALTTAKVYPGFFPGFTSAGVCLSKPVSFKDTSHAVYGVINSWSWDFGDPGSATNLSNLQNPSYIYNSTGVKNVQFIVSSSVGCVDTIYKDITIYDKPPIKLAFKDTLICRGDQPLQLHASGSGVFSWTPLTNIVDANTADPSVTPITTTSYFVQLDDQGCINKDTVQVRVVDFVTLKANKDSVICAGDEVQLGATTDGLKFNWTPSNLVNDPSLLNAITAPTSTTTYQITATIGHCSATDDMTITTIPYPGSNAGADTVICYYTTAQLHGSIKGSTFSWAPANTLSSPYILNPVASPKFTTSYILTVYDTLGCPKPGRDTVLVTMLPKVNAYAGKDTAVVIGQPLQLNATGGIAYEWKPATALNQANIPNPVAVYDGSGDSIRYKVMVTDEAGCVDSAYITVKVFKTSPQVFVPTAFTPNGDGLNDVFRPIAVGLTKIEYFSVYNRWGQLVFTTTQNGKGWDGKIGGEVQPSGTFVWMVKGVDYTGKPVFEKGTVTLIR